MRWMASRLIVGLVITALSASAARAQPAANNDGRHELVIVDRPAPWDHAPPPARDGNHRPGKGHHRGAPPPPGPVPGGGHDEPGWTLGEGWLGVATFSDDFYCLLLAKALYGGQYEIAERALQREMPDSICWHAMAGEVLYHLGRNAEALAEFDKVYQFWIDNPTWLLSVRFYQPPRPVPLVRRPPPWGRSARQFMLGRFPTLELEWSGPGDGGSITGLLVTPQGQVAGGNGRPSPVRPPLVEQVSVPTNGEFYAVNVIERLRVTCLAIRRRSELLGPLVAYDPLTKDLWDTLARPDLAPADHWSSVWVEQLRGLIQASVGNMDDAELRLGRTITIGNYDHPFTCVSLLELGRLAMIRGDSARAAELLAEASYSAYYYDNIDVLTESAALGWLNHMANGGDNVYPPLEAMAEWAHQKRLQHLAVKLRLAQAENLLWLGKTDAAAAVLDEAGRHVDEMRSGLPGTHGLYVQAALQMSRGQVEAGGQALVQALARQQYASLRNFQIDRANAMYDAGDIAPHDAIDLYQVLLADPSPVDWVYKPLEAMAVLQTRHDGAFDRWFLAALDCEDAALALEIAERTKRRRFLASQPLGGRLLALGAILESPTATLSLDASLQRERFLSCFPAYEELSKLGQRWREQLEECPIPAEDLDGARKLASLGHRWADVHSQEQRMLALLALSRLPSSFEYMPLLTAADLQRAVRQRETLVVFHAAGGRLYGFVLTRDGVWAWRLDDQLVRTELTALLQNLASEGSGYVLSAAQLRDTGWKKSATDLYCDLFADVPVDIANARSVVIVPDGVLWYLPFEALVPDGSQPEVVLADLVPLRYGPTASLAVSNGRPLRRPQHTGIILNEPPAGRAKSPSEKILQELEEETVQQLEKSTVGPVRLSPPREVHLMAPLLDGLVVFDAEAADDEAAWTALPYGGPERIVLAGFSTKVEQGPEALVSTTSDAAGQDEEAFQVLCSMMAGGARTILISRWRSGGRTNFDLVRQFVQEMPDMPAAEAWRRACILARETPLDCDCEPRLRLSDKTGEPLTADHPFFWAGYLLVDTSPPPEPEQ
jgi:hypothetical protein